MLGRASSGAGRGAPFHVWLLGLRLQEPGRFSYNTGFPKTAMASSQGLCVSSNPCYHQRFLRLLHMRSGHGVASVGVGPCVFVLIIPAPTRGVRLMTRGKPGKCFLTEAARPRRPC